MPVQCPRFRHQVSHLSMYFMQNSSLERTYKVRDVHSRHYDHSFHVQTRVHLRVPLKQATMWSTTLTSILLEKQNWMFRPALFLEKDLGSSACYDHKIRSLYMGRNHAWTDALVKTFSSFCWEEVGKWKIMKRWTCNTCWSSGVTLAFSL